MKEKNFESVSVGKHYLRRDGKEAVVYHLSSVYNTYECVILGTTEFFTVNEDGQYLKSCIDCNDLVKEL